MKCEVSILGNENSIGNTIACLEQPLLLTSWSEYNPCVFRSLGKIKALGEKKPHSKEGLNRGKENG